MINKISTLEIEMAVARHFGWRQNIIVPNVSWGLTNMHECDMLVIRCKSHIAIEIEIKITKQDLIKDSTKNHHHYDERISELYFAIPYYLYDSCFNLIPDYAGILVCGQPIVKGAYESDYFPVHLKRHAKVHKFIHSMTDDEVYQIARLGTMRIWNLKKTILLFKKSKK